MKTIFEHIEHIKGKPHHIRKQVAFAAAIAGSSVVALVWFVDSIATGAFAIQGSNFAMSAEQAPAVATTSASGDQGLAGVDAATVLQQQNAPAHIEIVDTTPPAPVKPQSDQTVLPF
jgi:hypothetical protein